MSARRISWEEAQYWLERSKKQDVFQGEENFSKLDHLAEFGPLLSANVYKNKSNSEQSQITSPVTKAKAEFNTPSTYYTNNGRYCGSVVPKYILENDIHIQNDDLSVPKLEYFEQTPLKCAPKRNNNFKHEADADEIGGTPVEYPILRESTINRLKEDVEDYPEKSEQFSVDNKFEVASGITIDTVEKDITDISRNNRIPLVNMEREITSPFEISCPEILKHGYKHDHDIPSVSKILAATMSEKSKEVLARWEKEKIALLGLDGFKKLKSDNFTRGHTLHTMLEDFMETRQLPKAKDIPDSVSKRHLVSISQAVKQFHTPLLLESAVTHPDLNYSGIVDCVAMLGDTVMLVDWKTSEKVKNKVSDLYDNPLQLAAYMGALNRDERYRHLGNINNGAVVVVYNSGYPAMVHTFNQKEMEVYWDMWCDRLEMFKNM